MILDDSSSALDYRTDAALRKALREEYRGITTIIIAQRVSSILHADHILVLEEGKELGYGTHEELLRSCQVYQEIANPKWDTARMRTLKPAKRRWSKCPKDPEPIEKPKDRKKSAFAPLDLHLRPQVDGPGRCAADRLQQPAALLGPMLSGELSTPSAWSPARRTFPPCFSFCGLMIVFYAVSSLLSYILSI